MIFKPFCSKIQIVVLITWEEMWTTWSKTDIISQNARTLAMTIHNRKGDKSVKFDLKLYE